MELDTALSAFDALSQNTRLEALRFLVRAGPFGAPAGDIARALKVPNNTMSSHLTVLSHAGLVASERQGRSILYRVRFDTMRDLIGFLMTDCCQGALEFAPNLPFLPTCFDGVCNK